MLRNNFEKRVVFSAMAVLFIFAALFGFVSCESNGAGDDPVPDDSLLPRLTGTWQDKGGEAANAWRDVYVITNTSVTRISSQGGAAPTTETGTIEHVYNFNTIAGCVIVKYSDTKYNAVYFNNLLSSTGTVDLTGAYVAADGSSSEVKTLDEAKDRFRPENAKTYGGGDTQSSTRYRRYVDSHKLNPLLLGTFESSGGTDASAWTDDYVVTNATVTHISSYGGGAPTIETGSIEYVYNITDTAGSIIVKYTSGSDSGKYNAVHFKDLTSTKALLGGAWMADYSSSAVSTLDAAKGRFAPANAEAYLGWTAQTGTPQPKFVDNNQLNRKLEGTWTASGGTGPATWTDTYTITLGTGGSQDSISHPGDYGYNNATIEYVYNITDTAGCLIIKYTGSNGKYDAVYFRDLTDTQVLLGDAFDATNSTYEAAVDDLETAQVKFAPANAEAYGGWTAQIGTPQRKQP